MADSRRDDPRANREPQRLVGHDTALAFGLGMSDHHGEGERWPT
jgi:hypothetical protein